MAKWKWLHQIPLLTFLVIIKSLGDCQSNTTDSNIHNVTSTESKRPRLLVFNLDLVIWPFRVDNDIVTPVKRNKKAGVIQDFVMKPLGVYSDAVETLNTLYLQNYRMAAVSDSPDVETNTKLLWYFNLYNYFPLQEIFGGPKREHLDVIHRTTQIPYSDMFYFDVANGQLDELRKMGVRVVEVCGSGLNKQDFDRALDTYRNSNVTTATTAS